jgi:hypothetical protein
MTTTIGGRGVMPGFCAFSGIAVYTRYQKNAGKTRKISRRQFDYDGFPRYAMGCGDLRL